MLPEDDIDQSFATLLRDLDTVRKRLDQAQEWLRDGATSVTAADRSGGRLDRRGDGAEWQQQRYSQR